MVKDMSANSTLDGGDIGYISGISCRYTFSMNRDMSDGYDRFERIAQITRRIRNGRERSTFPFAMLCPVIDYQQWRNGIGKYNDSRPQENEQQQQHWHRPTV
ncbi:hypothetical protein BLOT_012275 [Blomia tropicalis]|nr:hypothetical protein BLOT_012275 [Blomia tropicalis]